MTKDMTKGNPTGLLLQFGIPMLIGNTLQQFYSIADTAIVGRGIGTSALAAVGATGSLNWFVMGFITGFTHGFSISISQYFGQKDEKGTKKSIVMSLYLSLIIAVAVSVLSAVFSRQLLTLMGTPEDIMDEAVLYITLIFAGAFTIVMYNIAASILRSLGDSKTPTVVIFICSAVNIVLDLLFVCVFGWGVAGAAVATLIASFISGIICLIVLSRIPMLKLTKDDLKWDSKIAAELIKLGLPVGLMNSVTAVGTLILQWVVNSFGSATVAAYTLGTKIVGLADQATNVLCGMALGTYVGQNKGAGRLDRVRLGVRSAVLISVVMSVIVTAIMIFLGKPIASIFVSSGETQAVDGAYPYLVICGSMIWSLCLLFVFRFALQGLGDTVVPMFSGFLELALRLSVVFIIPASFGFYRVCWAEVSAWCGAMIMLGIGYFVRMRKLTEEKG